MVGEGKVELFDITLLGTVVAEVSDPLLSCAVFFLMIEPSDPFALRWRLGVGTGLLFRGFSDAIVFVVLSFFLSEAAGVDATPEFGMVPITPLEISILPCVTSFCGLARFRFSVDG